MSEAVPEKRQPRRNDPDYLRWYREKNRDRILAQKRERHRKNPEVAYFSNVKRWYGVTRDQWERMNESQNATCAICGISFSELKRRACVDHNHATGKVRALLCGQCNVQVGIVENESPWRERVINYIKQHRG